MDEPRIHDERDAIAQVLADSGRVNGDDAAVLRVGGGSLCVSTDSTVAGVHAPLGTTPHDLGRRACARALSDLAAMGAAPIGITCAVHVPAGGWDDAVAAVSGVRERAGEQHAELVGGDFTRVPDGSPLALVVTVLGRRAGSRREPFVPRSQLRVGDELHVTGALGAAATALSRGEVPLPEPPDRIRAGIVLAPFASAMVDMSDGLARDARHLAAASGCSVLLDLDELPLSTSGADPVVVAGAGDDYELLVGIPPARVDDARVSLQAACPELTLTRIGVAADHAGDYVHAFHAGRRIRIDDGFLHR